MDLADSGQKILDKAFGGKLGNAGPVFDEFDEPARSYLLSKSGRKRPKRR